MEWDSGNSAPLKYASPKKFGGSNIKGRGAKASALKTSLEIASTSVREAAGLPGCGEVGVLGWGRRRT